MLLKVDMRLLDKYCLVESRYYFRERFFLLIGSVRSLNGVFGKTLGGMREMVDGVGEGGDLEGEDERNSSTSPLQARLN